VKRAAESDSTPVLSAERLSGNPHSGGYDSLQTAERLHRLFPQAKVLVVVREQTEEILSCYNQYVRAGGVLPLRAYLDPPDDFRFPAFRFDYFMYDRLIGAYRRPFGHENVCILPFEWFTRIPAQFVGKIHDLVGVARPVTDLLPHAPKVNPSVTQVATAALRRFNRIAAPRTTINPQVFSHDAGIVRTRWGVADFSGRIATAPANIRQKTRRLDLIRTQTSGLYELSSRRLVNMTGLELDAFGYAVGPEGAG
jgi:hypothetical protein